MQVDHSTPANREMPVSCFVSCNIIIGLEHEMSIQNKFAVATLFVALLTAPVLAAPAMVMGDKANAITAAELCSRMGAFDEKDIADFVAADSVTVYRVSDAYPGSTTEAAKTEDNAKVCGAMTSSASAIGSLDKAIAANPEAAKWFNDNGFNVNDAVAIVHNPANNQFELYLR
jgi:hypothetical protein